MAQENYPISNVEYDLLSVLHTKLQGLEAYKKYIEDARKENNKECEQMFNEMMQQDRQHAERLHQTLASFVSRGGQGMQQRTGTQPGMQGRA